MRKPLTIIITVLFLSALVYITARVVLADGPCSPKQPAPLVAS